MENFFIFMENIPIMKKLTLACILLASFAGFAQITYPESSGAVFERKNELKIGAIHLLSGHSLDIGYEHIQDRNRGFGANLMIGFGDDVADYQPIFSLSPYYRFYFNSSQEYGARGMYAEGFTDFYTAKEYGYYSNYIYDDNYGGYYDYQLYDKKYFEIAAGVALGWKWVNTVGFVLDIKAGYGRNLLGATDYRDGIFRGDVSLGYRF